MKKHKRHSVGYLVVEGIMITLALVSAGFAVAEVLRPMSVAQLALVERLDQLIGLIFLTDFCTRLFLAASRERYLKHNWWLLLCAVPFSDPVMASVRLIRLLRLLRLARAGGHLEYSAKG